MPGQPTLDGLWPEDGRRARRFVLWLAILLGTALTVHGGFNLLIDPYGFYGKPLGFETTWSVRHIKLGLLRRAPQPPEALIVGSSRVRMLDPTIVQQRFGVRTFHAGGPVGGIADWLSFTQHAVRDLGYPIRLVIIGADPPSFTSQPSLWLHAVNYPQLRPHLRHPLLTRVRSWVHLISPEQTKMSWRRLTAQSPESVRRSNFGFASRWRRDGFRPVNPPLDSEGIFQGNVEAYKSHHPIDPGHRADFEALADFAFEHGITIVSFITPEAPRLRQALAGSRFGAHKEKVEAILRGAADRGVIYCDVDILRLRTQDFVDPHHMSYEGGSRVLRILEICAKTRGWKAEPR